MLPSRGQKPSTPAPIDSSTVDGWTAFASDYERTNEPTNPGELPEDAAVEPFVDGGQYLEQEPILTSSGLCLGIDGTEDQNRKSGFHAFDHDAERLWVVEEEKSKATPTQVGETIFLTSGGSTRAVDAATGEAYWSLPHGTGRPQSSPGFADGDLYVCSDGVVAVDARTGEIRWTAGEDRSQPMGIAISGKALYVTAGDSGSGVVYRVDRESGNLDWITNLQNPSYAVPVITDHGICITETNGTLRLLGDVAGIETWAFPTGENNQAHPAYSEGTVYFVPTSGERLYAIDAKSGAVNWEFGFDGGGPQTPTVMDGFVYFPTAAAGGTVHKIDAETGEEVADWALPQKPSSSLVIYEDTGLISTGVSETESVVYVITDST
ncbi:PQQ-binding-like beta-propeller repeat protein [Haloarchaeobius sp. TZWWS8]|uniref:PQQ-binding-like beta-propeller repeat protein n=1 Tax=Haloarchaeobius sp. TZWWS8 TaxID=3446121 RepID=UPI003EC0675B